MPQRPSDRSDAIVAQAEAEPLTSPERPEREGTTLSLSELAYERILEMLFARRLPAGAFVSQNDLVGIVGVPVAPLRDALRVLQTEGLLTIHPRSGIRFLKPDFEFARHTYQFRSVLERPAVRVFAEMATPERIMAIRVRHEACIALLAETGFTADVAREAVALDALLHFEIIGALGNPLIESTYRRVHNYLQLIRLDRTLSGPIVLRTLKEHLDLLDACLARDPDRAEASLQLHFTQALQRTMGIF
ncbi:transcriptional regulator, GntR family [Kaistia soli DSM 19436]|uniref:Transcriptional regulator, GntR family n=1 Tax=Kaistia soli DSM 19436 TaxID=1122133 RepID=A0A1M4XFZ3_9HYPH|nr:GntR family transcriptional regulator [Kaistia soli]SHE92445.1 transcriptional regulator, GntR family [Kaistia soli DSM 19436]